MSADTLVNDLVDAIHEGIDSRLSNLHTAMPAIIQKYDPKKQKADVQPVLKRKFLDGEVEAIPVITNVPVVMPRTAKAFINLPLAKGDYVLLVFAERSLDKWLSGGGVIDPEDPRKHHLSDAIAIPGVWPFSESFSGDGNNLTMCNDKMRIELLPSGKVRIKNDAGNELVDLCIQLIDAITTGTVATSIGAQLLINTEFSVIKTKLMTLKG